MLQGKTVLVTGAAGFVGGHAAWRLAQSEGAQVRALIRNPNMKTVVDLNHPAIARVQGELLDPDSLRAAAAGCDLVIHAAAAMRPMSRRQAWRVLLDGTRNLYTIARESGVPRFVFLSSFAVYFARPRQREDENAPLARSGDLYGDGKIAAEQMLRTQPAGGPQTIILRLPPIYGPGSYYWSARPMAIARKGRLFIPAGGDFPVPYVFIDNLIDAILAAARSSIADGTYNILDGYLCYRRFLEPYADAAGTELRYMPASVLLALAAACDAACKLTHVWTPFSMQSARFLIDGSHRPEASSAKAARDFGWSSRVGFAQGIERTLAWLSESLPG